MQNFGYRHGLIEQLARMALTTGGAFLFGDSIAQGEAFQTGVGAVVAATGFLWWAVREYMNRLKD